VIEGYAGRSEPRPYMGVTARVAEGEDFECGVELRFAEGGGFIFRERAEFAGTRTNCGGWNVIGH
jgi:hypothetical protein